MSTGYLNRFIRLTFEEIGGVDDNGNPNLWLIIRNPRLIPSQDLLGGAAVATDADGKPLDPQAANEQMLAMMSKLIVAGRIWDPAWVPEFDANGDPVESDVEAPLLKLPLSPEDAGKLPIEILNAVGEELKKVNPQ